MRLSRLLAVAVGLAAAAAAQPIPTALPLLAVEHPVASETMAQAGRPLAVRSDGVEMLVSDFDDYRVERVTPQGAWVGAVGAPAGTGRLLNVSDVTAHGDTLWIADLESRAIAVYLRDGGFVRWLRLGFHPARVAVLPDGLAVLGVGGERPLALLDRNGAVRSWIAADLGTPSKGEMGMSNAVLAPTPEGFLFFHVNGDAAIRFDAAGAEVARLPLHLVLPDGRFVDARQPRSLSVDGDVLWMHSRLSTPGGHQTSVLDRYRLSTNAYEGSARLPRAFRDVAVIGDHAVGIDADGLVRFDLRATGPSDR